MSTITDTTPIPVLKDIFNIAAVEPVKQDKFLSKEHPLAGHMKITPQWSTPIGEMELNLSEEMRIGLIKFIASRGYCTTMGTHKKTQTPEFEANHYNMFEFGEDEEVGQHIRPNVQALITVGDCSHQISDGLQHKMASIDHCYTADEAADVLRGVVASEDLVLLKGSRDIKLERVLSDFL